MKTLAAIVHEEWFKASITTVLGFLIAQVTGLLSQRGEAKKAASRVLTELLEVRHQFIALEHFSKILDDLTKLIGNFPEHDKAKLLIAAESLLPKPDELHARYDQSVSALAPLHPLLAFELRSKDHIRPLLTTARSLMGQDPKAAALMGPLLKEKLISNLEPVLNKSILKLAWKKGVSCWYRTRRFLKQKEVPRELQEYLDSVKKIIEAQTKMQAAQANSKPHG